jgi:predicted nucleic acid-binding protein
LGIIVKDLDILGGTPVFRGKRGPVQTLFDYLEAMYLLSEPPLAQQALGEMLERGAVSLPPLDSNDIPRIRELRRKYANRRMELADAALVRVAEQYSRREIFTVDRGDLSVYRLHNSIRPTLIPS